MKTKPASGTGMLSGATGTSNVSIGRMKAPLAPPPGGGRIRSPLPPPPSNDSRNVHSFGSGAELLNPTRTGVYASNMASTQALDRTKHTGRADPFTDLSHLKVLPVAMTYETYGYANSSILSLLICIIDPVSVAMMPDAFLCMYRGKLCIAMPGFLVGDGEQVQQQQYNVVLSSVSVFAIYATNDAWEIGTVESASYFYDKFKHSWPWCWRLGSILVCISLYSFL